MGDHFPVSINRDNIPSPKTIRTEIIGQQYLYFVLDVASELGIYFHIYTTLVKFEEFRIHLTPSYLLHVLVCYARIY